MIKINNEYYVYEWFNIDTGEVFYVGKGRRSRYKTKTNRNRLFNEYYNSHNCDVRKVYINLSEEEALHKEMELIKYYRENTNYRLTNHTDGGDGTFAKDITDEYRDKMRQLVMGENNPNYGHRWTEEMKQEARDRCKNRNYFGKNNPNFGHKWTAEMKEKASNKRKADPRCKKENHGRAKKWIILETGDIAILKENIKNIISNLPKIPTSYHYVEYEPELETLNGRLKRLSKILTNKFKIFVDENGNLIYGYKNLYLELRKLGIKEKVFNDIKNNDIIKYKNHTYYLLSNSPFIQ